MYLHYSQCIDFQPASSFSCCQQKTSPSSSRDRPASNTTAPPHRPSFSLAPPPPRPTDTDCTGQLTVSPSLDVPGNHCGDGESGLDAGYEMAAVRCRLETKELWEKFHDLGTEMIITKTGRYAFSSSYLKTLDTIGICQRPVFSLGVSQHMHKTTNL